jgi:hypothetical protein
MGRMQTTRTQMALVIDEYGGTDGLGLRWKTSSRWSATSRTLHDDDEPHDHPGGDGVFIVDGKAEIDDALEDDRRGILPANRVGRYHRRHDLQHAWPRTARGEVVQAIPASNSTSLMPIRAASRQKYRAEPEG